MKKTIKITVPEPCHEDWSRMTPTQKGRHCMVCEKEVIDFTNYTDETLVQLAHAGNNLCGRFKKTQLGREIVMERKSNFSFYSLAASLIMPFTLLTNNSTKPAKETKKPFYSLHIGSIQQNKAIKVSGYVNDSFGNPLEGVSISTENTSQITITDSFGGFQVKAEKGQKIIFSYGKLANQFFEIGAKSELLHIVISDKEIKISVTGTNLKTMTSEIKPSKIKGVVYDENNLPFPGVNVIVKNTNKWTQTDFDGNFNIEAYQNQILIISHKTYKTIEIPVSNEKSISIILEVDPIAYEEFRVVAGRPYISKKSKRSLRKWNRKREKLEKKN